MTQAAEILRKEHDDEGEDEHEGRQRIVGRLIEGFPIQPKQVSGERTSKNSRERSKAMKVKTNTKAGNAMWGT